MNRCLKTVCCFAGFKTRRNDLAAHGDGPRWQARHKKKLSSRPVAATKPLSAVLPPEKWRQMESAV